MGYQHTNTRGVTYYLNAKDVTLRGGKVQTIYYFSKDVRETAADLLETHEPAENPKNGFLTIKRKVVAA